MINNTHEIEKLKREVWYLKTIYLPALNKKIELLSGDSGAFKELSSKVDELTLKLNDLQSQASLNADDIAEVSQCLANLSTSVEEILASDELTEQALNNLSSEIAKIKTSISALESAKTTLTVEVSTLKNKVAANETSISAINNDITSHGNRLTELEENDLTNDQTVAALATDLNTAKTDISSLKTAKTSMQTDISSLKTRATNLETTTTNQGKSITSLQTSVAEIPKLNTALNTLKTSVSTNTTNIGKVNTTLTSHGNKLTELEENDMINDQTVAELAGSLSTAKTDVSNLKNTTSSHTTSISSLNTKYNTLSATVESLKNNSGGGGGVVTDVIYDMRSTNASINRGFTSGIVGNKYFSFDFSPYKKIRVYASLSTCDCQTEISVAERYKQDFCLFAMNSTYTAFHFMKVMLASPTPNRFTAAGYASITITKSSGAVALENASSKTNMFVYRIEGIK